MKEDDEVEVSEGVEVEREERGRTERGGGGGGEQPRDGSKSVSPRRSARRAGKERERSRSASPTRVVRGCCRRDTCLCVCFVSALQRCHTSGEAICVQLFTDSANSATSRHTERASVTPTLFSVFIDLLHVVF